MEENKKKDGEYCVGPICYHCGSEHGHGKHVLFRWVIGIAILLITFWMGMKIGELKAMVGGYGYGMHSGYLRSSPMMNGYGSYDNYSGSNQINDRFWMMQ
jgi:hypothetical protein